MRVSVRLAREEVAGEREEWRFRLAKAVEELKLEVWKVVESGRSVAWPEESWSIESFGCPIAC